MTNTAVIYTGWGRDTWGSGAWSEPATVLPAASGSVGSPVVTGDSTVSVTGIGVTTGVGVVSVSGATTVPQTGFSATVETGIPSNTFTAYSNAQLSTAQAKFGVSSLRTDGTFDRVQPDTTNAWGSADYTVEFWIYFTSIPSGNQFLFDNRTGSNSGNLIYLDLNGRVGAVIDGGTSGSASPVSVATNTWHHLALVREGSTFRFFVNGVASSNNFASNTTDYGNRDYTVGSGYFSTPGAFGFNGWIDEFRASTVARYATNFTPSSSAFSPDDFTPALLHFDGSNGSTSIVNSASLGPVFVVGDAVASVTGVSATASVGKLPVLLEGVSATSAVGSVSAGSTVSVQLTGVSAIALVGGLPTQIYGVSATGAVGVPSINGATTVPVSSDAMVGGIGSVSVIGASSTPTTGIAASGGVGGVTVVEGEGTSVSATGSEATSAVGSSSAVGDASVSPSGVEASAIVGTASASGAVIASVTGLQATGINNGLSLNAKIIFEGWGRDTWGSGAWGRPTLDIGAAGQVGSVVVTPRIQVPVTGIQVTTGVGSVTVTGGTGIDVLVTGVSATGLLGPRGVTVWGRIVPDPTTSYTEIDPSVETTWTEIAA